jgi:hypothetical protein
MFSGSDGDEARYERYRDTRDGVYSSFNVNRLGNSYLFDASAYHIGYRDQRYTAGYRGSRAAVNFNWTSIPLNFSYLTRTPYTASGSTLSLSDIAQAAVQGPTNSSTDGAVGVPCAPGGPPAACGNPAQAAQALANRSIYNGLANTFDLRYRRDIANVNVLYSATHTIDIDGAFTTTKRAGSQPWGLVRLQQRGRTAAADRSADERGKPRRLMDEREDDVPCRVVRLVLQ